MRRFKYLTCRAHKWSLRFNKINVSGVLMVKEDEKFRERVGNKEVLFCVVASQLLYQTFKFFL